MKKIFAKYKNVASHIFVSLMSVALFTVLIQTNTIDLRKDNQEVKTPPIVEKETDANLKQVSSGNLTLQEIAEKVIPSIVSIQTYNLNSMNVSGEGSGIIKSSDGYIITNAHVIDGAKSIKVILHDGKSYEAKLIGKDTSTDLALIKIEDENLNAAKFGSSSDLKVADQVMAIGNPGGIKFSSSVTVGYVSGLNRPVESSGYTMESIQTDAAINPGNSGGALVNDKGEVIGINSAKIVAPGYEGLGFAIPIDTALPIIENIKEHGYVKDRASIGITYQFLDETTARFYNLVPGVYINSVTSDNAQKSGLKEGDILTEVEGEVISEASILTKFLTTKKPKDKVNFKVYRDGSYIDIKITLSEAAN